MNISALSAHHSNSTVNANLLHGRSVLNVLSSFRLANRTNPPELGVSSDLCPILRTKPPSGRLQFQTTSLCIDIASRRGTSVSEDD